MNTTSMRRREAFLPGAHEIDWGAVAAWALCFGLIVYLGMKGGGYDPLIHDEVAIAVWWVAVAGVAVGALPRSRPRTAAWIALGLLGSFVLWTALSLGWTESNFKTWADLARVVGYLGIFALVLLTRGRAESDRLIGAVAAGIAVVALAALLSRLHPAWFPEAHETANFLADSRERLSYPIHYWNGLAALIAIGIAPLLHVAAAARSIIFRALAAAAVPALALAIFYTLSRGGIAAAAIAVALFLAITADRLPRFLTALVTGAGGAVLIAIANQKDALQHGLMNESARQQGDDMLVIVIVVCLLVGLLQAAVSTGMTDERRPVWSYLTRRQAIGITAIGVVAVLVAALALDAPGRASKGWDEFKEGGGPGSGTGRLGSVAGQSRYEFWKAALDETGTKPLTGTGSGTFELWWARNATTDESVRDTHSLYLQTLGELGIVGLALLGAFLLTVFLAGAGAAMRADPLERSAIAAAIAGCSAFCLTAVVDWMWQIPVLATAFLILASLPLTERPTLTPARPRAFAGPLRAGFVAVALVAIVAIAIPLASTTLLRESESDARDGNLPGALEAARSSENAQPGAAPPLLQGALVLEARGSLSEAAGAAREATDREPTNWRNWLVIARLEAERGEVEAAVRDYRRARSLNPRSPIFAG